MCGPRGMPASESIQCQHAEQGVWSVQIIIQEGDAGASMFLLMKGEGTLPSPTSSVGGKGAAF